MVCEGLLDSKENTQKYVKSCKRCKNIDCAKNLVVVEGTTEERLKAMFDRRKKMYEAYKNERTNKRNHRWKT